MKAFLSVPMQVSRVLLVKTTHSSFKTAEQRTKQYYDPAKEIYFNIRIVKQSVSGSICQLSSKR
jgi:hypothetical protein